MEPLSENDVWLLTNILDPQKLSAKTAAKFYRWRWRNEGLFRTYKRTLKKFKLSSRTVKLIHRELEGSLLALQILLAHADLALRAQDATGEIAISPRKVLIQIRKEINRDSTSHRSRAPGNDRAGSGATAWHLTDQLNNLGYLYSSQGRYAEAEPLHRRALALR